MNSKSTWTWLLVALGLFALICVDYYTRKPQTGPPPVLPNFRAGAVTSVQVIPAGQVEIRADRTNDTWQLTRPLAYPARAEAIDSLLAVLERLTPATAFSIHELREHPKADAEFGFDSPQATVTVQLGMAQSKLLIGRRTPPGNQVYVQVVGVGDVYVVDADWLRLVPHNVAAWRDPALVDFSRLAFDRLLVTNGANYVELDRVAGGTRWRMSRPIPARANNDRIAAWLQQLDALRALQFTDDPKADLETYGLQPAELTLAFCQGNNPVALLEFGKSLTNDLSLVYARRRGWNTVLTVAKDLQAPWRASKDAFRDPRVVDVVAPVDQVEVRGEENFTLQRGGNAANAGWRLVPPQFPVDLGLANEMVDGLAGLRIEQFANDVVTEADLPRYGLKTPLREIILRSAVTNAASPTNAIIADLTFGTNQEGRAFVRRADEDSIYEVNPAVLDVLPRASWQLRERRIWNFSVNDVASVTIRTNSRAKQLQRDSPGHWSSVNQGVVVDDATSPALEETMLRLGELSASVWVARGDQDQARYGFKEGGHQITIELKNGTKLSLEFGGLAPSQYPYAAVTLDGQKWSFEFPLALYYQFIKPWLSPPSGAP